MKGSKRGCYHCSWMDELLSQLIRTNLNRPHKSMTLPSPGTYGFWILTCRLKRNGFWTSLRGVFSSGSFGNLCKHGRLRQYNPTSKSMCLDNLQDVERKMFSVKPFLTRNMEDFRVRRTREKKMELEFWKCRGKEKEKKSESLWVCVCPMSSYSTNVNPVVEDIVQIWTLALSFCFWALLVIGWIYKKKVKTFCFFSTTTLKCPQLKLFLDYRFVLASAQKKKVTFQ